MSIRVRFAPSPTGHVHIGNIRAAIFNWLYARHGGGRFLVRVEDTDRERSTPEAIETLLDVMAWLGLDFDEPPMYQSRRSADHLRAAEVLVADGSAYRYAKGGEREAVLFRIPWDEPSGVDVNVTGPASIDVHREVPVTVDTTGVFFAGISKKGKPMPGGGCLAGFRDLRVLDADGNCLFELEPNVADILSGGGEHSLDGAARLEFTRREVGFHDQVKGRLSKPLDSMKDLVIVRSDGSPVFHLANVCDDMAQGVTHIIRGDDHVENTYRHVFLFAALGATPPAYAHLPMIVNQQGKPYSKRDGDAFVGDFRSKGFLPQALFNYLALLGWNPGDEREKMSRNELIEAFSLDRVQQSPAQMDTRKLRNLNGQYIAELPVESFVRDAAAVAESHSWYDSADRGYFASVAGLLQTRTKSLEDVASWQHFFTQLPEYDAKACRKFLCKDGIREALAALKSRLETSRFEPEQIEQTIHSVTEDVGLGRGRLNQPIRIAITGCTTGAGVYETAAVLGRDRVLRRLAYAIENHCQTAG